LGLLNAFYLLQIHQLAPKIVLRLLDLLMQFLYLLIEWVLNVFLPIVLRIREILEKHAMLEQRLSLIDCIYQSKLLFMRSLLRNFLLILLSLFFLYFLKIFLLLIQLMIFQYFWTKSLLHQLFLDLSDLFIKSNYLGISRIGLLW